MGLSEKAKNIGYTGVFGPGTLNYRKWLIGQALSGCCATDDIKYATIAECAIFLADAVLERLAEEE